MRCPGPQCLSPCSDQLLHECCLYSMFAGSWCQSTLPNHSGQALEDSAEAKVTICITCKRMNWTFFRQLGLH